MHAGHIVHSNKLNEKIADIQPKDINWIIVIQSSLTETKELAYESSYRFGGLQDAIFN